jgi:xanthine/CO dehydrogenase XdhC/CoxF family maturation factor
VNDIYQEILQLSETDEPAAVATIVHTRGSTPREVGARMIVRAGGAIRGTIGGGCGEAEVWSEAMEVISTKQPRLIEVDLLSDSDDEGGRACGGLMYVYVEPLRPVEASKRSVGQSRNGIEGNE